MNVPDVWVFSRAGMECRTWPLGHGLRVVNQAGEGFDVVPVSTAKLKSLTVDGEPIAIQDVASDVWFVKKTNPQAMVHLTEKPVELAARAMRYSSRPGENVLDLFGGSGSTLIAAEMLGRNAFLMELDTLYCDVIVKRYEQFTGRKAEVQHAE